MDCVLTAVDTSAIQRYIFGTNRLREHVGASEFVLQATTRWVWETLDETGLRVNVSRDGTRDDAKTLEGGDLDAEVIYTAGGNAVVLFTDGEQETASERARAWARMLSRRALTDAPGLTLWVAHSQAFAWDAAGDDLGARLSRVFERLDLLKRTRQASTPVIGLGVTATCQSTGLVATGMDDVDPIRVSREVLAKTNKQRGGALDAAHVRFEELLADYRKLGLRAPEELDRLNPITGERSYIAVVHADGNGIGERFKGVWQGKANREGMRAIRVLSDAVNAAGQAALQRALAGLITPYGLIEPYRAPDFPVRPLIYGGDDVTFVCDGRLGLGLAARYLDAFERIASEKLGDRTTAAAGVAIVKTHYPFARAYELAEELTRSAKRLSREHSTLDWHIATSGLLADLNELRAREYSVPAGDLAMRPVYLRAGDGLPQQHAWRTWANVEDLINIFQTDDTWAGKRNKIKQLREVLREGDARVEQFCTVYQLPNAELPGYRGLSSLVKRGWLNGRCGYFDPIEALDMYVPAALDRRWLPEEVAP